MRKNQPGKPEEDKVEKVQQFADFLAALNEMNDPDPNSRLSPEAQAILQPLFREAEELNLAEEEKFRQGNIMLDAERFGQFKFAYEFLKDLEERGFGTISRYVYKERSEDCSDIEFKTTGFSLEADDLNRFAQIIGNAYAVNYRRTKNASVLILFRYDKLWKKIPDKTK